MNAYFFIKKITIKVLYLVFFLLSPFLFILIIFLKPLIIVRITPIMTNRYGHLSMNPEIYLVEKNKFPTGTSRTS